MRFHLPVPTHRPRFTLIELLVVVAIISVLAAILLPVLGKARSRAQVISCASNLKQVAMGSINYAEENDEWMMIANWKSAAIALQDNGENPAQWFGGADIVKCPTYNFLGNNKKTYGLGVFSSTNGLYMSYRLLGSRGNHAPGGAYFWGHYTQSDKIPKDSLTDSYSTYCASLKFLGRKVENDVPGGPTNLIIHEAESQPLAMDAVDPQSGAWVPYTTLQNVENNHANQDGYNIAWFDGHVTWETRLGKQNRYYVYNDGWMTW